jgi:hypothetical protein
MRALKASGFTVESRVARCDERGLVTRRRFASVARFV